MMRISHAIAALAALCTTALGGAASGMMGEADSQPSPTAAHTTPVEVSSDFGTTWQAASLGSGTTTLPVRVDPARLRSAPIYQSTTLRAATGVTDPVHVSFGRGALLSGSPAEAATLRVRSVLSTVGTCSADSFDRGNPNLLAAAPSIVVPVDTPPSGAGVTLPAGTPTTAGAPATACVEYSVVDPAAVGGGEPVTVGWPVSLDR